jgi:hypothetical protein
MTSSDYNSALSPSSNTNPPGRRTSPRHQSSHTEPNGLLYRSLQRPYTRNDEWPGAEGELAVVLPSFHISEGAHTVPSDNAWTRSNISGQMNDDVAPLAGPSAAVESVGSYTPTASNTWTGTISSQGTSLQYPMPTEYLPYGTVPGLCAQCSIDPFAQGSTGGISGRIQGYEPDCCAG